MILVFTGECTAFHHQCFKMVDMLINHFEHSMCGLNPCAAPHVPRKEGNKVEIKEEDQEPKHKKHKRMNKILDGDDFGWKIQSKKNISKRNACMDNSQSCVGDNNKFSILEDSDEEDDYSVDTESSADEVFQEPKISYDAETANAKDTYDIISRCNELNPEGHESEGECSAKSESIGVRQCVSKLEKEIKEKEKHIENHS